MPSLRAPDRLMRLLPATLGVVVLSVWAAGAPASLRAQEEVTFRVVAEGEDRMRALGDPSFFLGGEVAAGTDDRVYVRGGYVFGSLNEIYGAAIGLGLAYERFGLGVSRELPRGGPALEQGPVHLALGVAF